MCGHFLLPYVWCGRFGSERSEFEGNKLHCQYEREHIDQFSFGAREYLRQLVPPTEDGEAPEVGLPFHLLSRSALAALPLQERVKAVMVNGKWCSCSR